MKITARAVKQLSQARGIALFEAKKILELAEIQRKMRLINHRLDLLEIPVENASDSAKLIVHTLMEMRDVIQFILKDHPLASEITGTGEDSEPL